MEKGKNKELQNWKGTSQSDRLFKALLPEHIKIDERSEADLMNFASRYSELVRFFNSKNTPSASWDKFINNDISIFLSTIIATNIRAIDEQHILHLNELERARTADEKKQCLKVIFGHIVDIAVMINDWYRQASALNDNVRGEVLGMELEIETAIRQKLGRNLKRIKSLDLSVGETGGLGAPIGINYNSFDTIWALEEVKAEPIFGVASSFSDKVNLLISRTRLIYRTFLSVLTYLVNRAPYYLEESLDNKSNHKPDVALYIAFLKLFKHSQDHLNTMTKRHLDYYYYKVLQQDHGKVEADKVNVYFELADHISEYYIEEGTLLDAGTDENGVELVYKLDSDLMIHQDKIASLKSIFVSKNAFLGIGSSFQLITNIYSAPIANSRDGLGKSFIHGNRAWPTFGEEQFDKAADEHTMIPADVGFAVSAPILRMDEGQRNVNMVFQFDRVSASTLNRLILDISRNKQLSRPNTYFLVFQDSLEILLTGENGWLPIEDYVVSPPEEVEADQFNLAFELPQSAPSIVDYDPEIHGAGFVANQPIIKILLRKEASSYVYSFLRDLVLETIFINVDVKNVKGLDIYNDIGRLDANSPFQPFGPSPRVGSYLLVGKSEIFRKGITDLKFHIDWQGLPEEEGGFEAYYSAYDQGINNYSFQVKLTALSKNTFLPVDINEQPQFSLFTGDYMDGALMKKTTFEDYNINALDIQPNFQLDEIENFDNYTPSGFFKLELISPKMGFGGDIYPTIFAKAAVENSRPKRRGLWRIIETETIEMPNPPASPSIKSLTLDYSASARINVLPSRALDKDREIPEKIFHIHPFGILQTFSGEATLDRFMVPQFNENAYLFIGIRDLVPPQRVSLLFQMKESEVAHTFRTRPEIGWAYLREGEWEFLSEEKILSDTTDGFTATGIIQIDVPRDIEKGSNILDKDLHWLRISVKGDVEMLSKTFDVYTQAVSATWEDRGNEDHIGKVLPAYSVINLVDMIPEIRTVTQPHASYGGKVKEEQKSFYTRISERLRHKQRSITSWDYERLVLERFPEIYQVKCVPHSGNEEFVDYGTVLIVVVPRIDHASGYFEPKVNYNTLQAIKEYLQVFSSPFVNIEVRNPVYEKLKISCGVVFNKGKNNGIFLEKLNKEIRKFVCPWMFGESMELDLGGGINKNTVLSFVEKRPYVKFITRFSMVQVINDEGYYSLEDTARDTSHSPVIAASKPWSVLVPLESHPISFLERIAYQSPDPAGIDTMIVGTDFIVKDESEEHLDDRVEERQFQKFSGKRALKTESGKRFFLKINLDKLKK
ncbi:MAG: baseplate J/gp47 family protein [Bacteroidota bacterium]